MLLAACGSKSPPPPAEPVSAPIAEVPPDAAPGSPACRIDVDELGFRVDGERYATARQSTVAQLVLRDGATLVASEDGGQLWVVDCRRTPQVTLVVADADGSVIHGRLAPDEKTFVIANGDGLAAVDLASLAVRTVYKTPKVPPPHGCAMLPSAKGGGAPQPSAVDGVDRFADEGRTLVVHRTWGCHYPDTYEYRLTDWADPARARLHPARPIYDVAAAGTTVWFGDGGGLWKSTDRGGTWKRVPIKGSDAPPADIFVDAKRTSWLVVRTSKHAEVAEGARGSEFDGPVLRTKNAGATWAKVKTPTAAVSFLAAQGGNVDHLVVATGEYDESASDTADAEEAPAEGPEGPVVNHVANGANGFLVEERHEARYRGWRSTSNGGTTWAKTEPLPPRVHPRRAVLGADTFETTGDGLYRVRDGKRELVTQELATPYSNDAF